MSKHSHDAFAGGSAGLALPDYCAPALPPLAAGAAAAGRLLAGVPLPLMAAGAPAELAAGGGVAVLVLRFMALAAAAPPLPPLPAGGLGGAQRKFPTLSLAIFAPGQDDNPSVPSSPHAQSNPHAIDTTATTCFISTPSLGRARIPSEKV